MDADYDIFEIVNVIRDFWLFDAESYQRRYFTLYDQPLEPGFYVVNWPEQIRARRFNEHAQFHGPFSMRRAAQLMLDHMKREREESLKTVAVKMPVTVPITSRKTATKQHRLDDGMLPAKVA